ncbi:tetratricopeptide repeat protein [Nocardia sp. NPDC046763]|uniref:tetratricopeptide repeat protein n=1 Tax=Nocardia sp. NPDC046763 TaxID=3155256 RepID=UPI0033DED5C5
MSEFPWPSALFLDALALIEDGAVAAALTLLDAALAECEGPDRIEARAECLYWIGAAHARTDAIDEAASAYRRAADLLADAPPTELPVACAEMAGRGLALLDRPAEAVPYLHRAAAGLELLGDMEEQAEIHEVLGDALLAVERYDEAIPVLRRAAERYLDVDRVLDAAECRESCGDAAVELGDARLILDEHRAARDLFERAGDTESSARCSYVLGLASTELGDTATAESEFVHAKALAAAEGNAAGAANCDEELADRYLADGRTADGLAALTAAGSGYAAAGDHPKAAAMYWRAGELQLRAGRHDAAISSCMTAAEELRAAGEPELWAGSRLALGHVLNNVGRLPEAAAEYEGARQYFSSHDKALEAAECDLHLATVHIAQDRYTAADALLRTATAVFDQHRHDPRYAQCLRYTALLQGFRGHIAEARATLAVAQRFATAAGALDEVRQCRFEEARLILNSGAHLPEAATLLEQARRHAEQQQEWAMAAQCTEFLGIAQFLQNRYAAAETTLKQARDAYSLLGLSTQIATADLHLGMVYYETGRFTEADAAIQRGRARLEGASANRYGAMTEHLIGGMHLRAKRYPLAAEAFRSAEAALLRSGLPFQAAVTRLNLGTAIMMQSDFATGSALMTSAIDVLGADPGYRMYRAMGLLNLGCADMLLGRSTVTTHLTRARQIYADLGMVVAMAKCDLLVAVSTAEPGDPQHLRAALDHGVPAMLFLDAQRFGFADARSRISWETLHAEAQSAVFDWAHRLGDTALLADLVETAINSGTHVAEHHSTVAQGDLQVTLAALAASDADPGETSGDREPPAPQASGAVALISGAMLPMRPSPTLRMPDGHVALASHLCAADSRYMPIDRPGEVTVW